MPTSGTITKYVFLVISHIYPVISKELDNMIEKRGYPEIKSVRQWKIEPRPRTKSQCKLVSVQPWKRNWLVKSELNETCGVVGVTSAPLSLMLIGWGQTRFLFVQAEIITKIRVGTNLQYTQKRQTRAYPANSYYSLQWFKNLIKIWDSKGNAA